MKRIDLKRNFCAVKRSWGANPTEVVNAIKDVMKDYELPRGIKVDFTGGQEERRIKLFLAPAHSSILIFLIL